MVSSDTALIGEIKVIYITQKLNLKPEVITQRPQTSKYIFPPTPKSLNHSTPKTSKAWEWNKNGAN